MNKKINANFPLSSLTAITTEYQPIVCTSTFELYGYEALARFKKEGIEVDTATHFFNAGEECLEKLFSLEIQAKEEQIKHRPSKEPLFLNINHRLLATEYYERYWKRFLKTNENIVVELLENNKKSCSMASEVLTKNLEKLGVPFAVDDLFADHSTFSSGIFLTAPIVKLDKMFLQRVREKENYIEFLRGIATFCNMNNKMLIIEGVETEYDLSIAKECNIGLVQGYYFKERFITSG